MREVSAFGVPSSLAEGTGGGEVAGLGGLAHLARLALLLSADSLRTFASILGTSRLGGTHTTAHLLCRLGTRTRRLATTASGLD